MKNKTFYINILLLFIIFFNKANSDNLEFLTKDIEILDKGNLIQAENDIKIIDKIDKIEITAEKFRAELKKYKIETRSFFWPIHRQDIFKKINIKFQKHYSNSDYLSKYGFYLPSGLDTKNNDIDYVCDNIKKIVKKFNL